MAQNFDDCRRKWLTTEHELESCKEVLTKAETERGSLEVKLKHARNQVDVEIRRRQKAEADCEKLVCRMQISTLVCLHIVIYSPLVSPSSGSGSVLFVLFCFCNAGPSNSVDKGPSDHRGIIKQHPAECRAALSSGLPEHKLSGSNQPEYKPKVRNSHTVMYCRHVSIFETSLISAASHTVAVGWATWYNTDCSSPAVGGGVHLHVGTSDT